MMAAKGERTMRQAYQFMKENGPFYLATTEVGRPRVRPFGAVAIYEGRLYICTNLHKDVFAQMRANPSVEISATSRKGEWLRLSATAVYDPDIGAKAAMIAANPSLKATYAPDDDVFAVLYLSEATARFCTFTAEPRVVTF